MNFREIESDEQFRAFALETFRRQARQCPPYSQYLQGIGFGDDMIDGVDCIEKIPFMPIELFKGFEVYCCDKYENPPEAIFTSSGEVSSQHFMKSLEDYESAFFGAFEQFYGDIEQWSIYALLPSYLEREGSSLIYMVDKMVEAGRGGGFYLYDHEALVRDMVADKGKKILLGVSYALLDLAEGDALSSVSSADLGDLIVMETGGMKGQREELPKVALHTILCRAFGVDHIHSEYGMAELTSQGYSSGGGIFAAPAWLKVLIRDVSDPFDVVSQGQIDGVVRGGVNIIDLASQHSCAFIETQDMGRLYGDGRFEIEGRVTGSDIRGCNLLL
ncbi:MAG: acyltransferase [Rikenellaceae bacterium]